MRGIGIAFLAIASLTACAPAKPVEQIVKEKMAREEFMCGDKKKAWYDLRGVIERCSQISRDSNAQSRLETAAYVGGGSAALARARSISPVTGADDKFFEANCRDKPITATVLAEIEASKEHLNCVTRLR